MNVAGPSAIDKISHGTLGFSLVGSPARLQVALTITAYYLTHYEPNEVGKLHIGKHQS